MDSYLLALVSLAGLLLLPVTFAGAGDSASSVVFISSAPALSREVVMGGAGCQIQKCGFTLDPVCGSDGRTHGSECHLQNRACRYGQTISLVHKGNCKRRASYTTRRQGRDSCQGVKCVRGAKCREVDGKAKCLCTQSASTTLTPICASDGNTYGSIDDMYYSNCENRTANEKVLDKPCK